MAISFCNGFYVFGGLSIWQWELAAPFLPSLSRNTTHACLSLKAHIYQGMKLLIMKCLFNQINTITVCYIVDELCWPFVCFFFGIICNAHEANNIGLSVIILHCNSVVPYSSCLSSLSALIFPFAFMLILLILDLISYLIFWLFFLEYFVEVTEV